MENNLSPLQQYIRQNLLIIGIFFVLQILFIIFIVAIIVNNSNKNTFEISNTPIFNLTEEIKDLPTTSVEPIQTGLYSAVELNKGTLQSIEKSDAKVRENSVVDLYFEKQDIHYINFIVDIPSIQQSYQVFHEWTDNKTNPYYLVNRATQVMCLPQDEAIYTDFACNDGQNGYKKYFLVDSLEPLATFHEPTVGFQTKEQDGAPFIEISVISCGDQKIIEQAKNEVDTFFKTLGFSLSDFNYEIPDYCEY